MKTDSNEIALIAACLADNFCNELYEFANSSNLFGYIDTLNEISKWAHLFYFDYDKQMKDWEKFEASTPIYTTRFAGMIS
jgi:hypothetical protein